MKRLQETSKPNRNWLPRFGLKSMFALVLVVGAYFGSWPWLESLARQQVAAAAKKRFDCDMNNRNSAIEFFPAATSMLPSVLAAGETAYDQQGKMRYERERYYLWLFGWTVRLPITTELQ